MVVLLVFIHCQFSFNKLIRQNEMYRFGKTKCDYFV